MAGRKFGKPTASSRICEGSIAEGKPLGLGNAPRSLTVSEDRRDLLSESLTRRAAVVRKTETHSHVAKLTGTA